MGFLYLCDFVSSIRHKAATPNRIPWGGGGLLLLLHMRNICVIVLVYNTLSFIHIIQIPT